MSEPLHTLNKSEIAYSFRCHVLARFKTSGNAAAHYSVGERYIRKVCNGDKLPNTAMLADLGYQKVTLYQKLNGNP